MIDIHCHILPGMDDGAQTMEQSLKMARIAVADGIVGIVATPHIISGVYNYTKAQILEETNRLNQELSLHNIPLSIYPGGEHHLEWELLQLLEKGDIMTLNDGGKYILVELPAMDIPQYTEDILFEISLAGLIPIIAHPERNAQLTQDPNQLYGLLEKGVLCQITAASLYGKFGGKAAETARYFMRQGWVHFVASDAHSSRVRRPILSKAASVTEGLAGETVVASLFRENPLLAVRGKEIGRKSHIEPNYHPKGRGKSLLCRLFSRQILSR